MSTAVSLVVIYYFKRSKVSTKGEKVVCWLKTALSNLQFSLN